MSTVIYWFSGTGNTLWLARAVRDGLGETELIPMAAGDASAAASAERVGLAFPVYSWGLPMIVNRFIRRLQVSDSAYLFTLMTCGADPGSAALVARKRLAARGLSLAASFFAVLPDNYPPFGGAPAAEKRQRLMDEASPRVGEIVQAIKNQEQDHYELGKLFWRGVGRMVYPLFAKHVAAADRKFTVDDTCTKCGLCEKVCPVANIELVDGRPRWLGHCEQCYACFHWCPADAIQYGKRTRKQERYHHPACKANDLIVR